MEKSFLQMVGTEVRRVGVDASRDILRAESVVRLNDYLIDTMAVSIDVVIPEGDIDERYRQLKGCLQAKQKYEINRFR